MAAATAVRVGNHRSHIRDWSTVERQYMSSRVHRQSALAIVVCILDDNVTVTKFTVFIIIKQQYIQRITTKYYQLDTFSATSVLCI